MDEEIGVKRPLEAPSEATARGGFRCLAELMSLLEKVFSGSGRGRGGGVAAELMAKFRGSKGFFLSFLL